MGGRHARTVGKSAADLIERFDQAATVVPGWDEPAAGTKHSSQIGAPEIRHAKEPLVAPWVVIDRVYRHNMSMLEPREDAGLVAIRPRYLDGHQSSAKIDFLGEIDSCESPSSQLHDDAKAGQLVSGT